MSRISSLKIIKRIVLGQKSVFTLSIINKFDSFSYKNGAVFFLLKWLYS